MNEGLVLLREVPSSVATGSEATVLTEIVVASGIMIHPEVLEKVEAVEEADRTLGQDLHEGDDLIQDPENRSRAHAPDLVVRFIRLCCPCGLDSFPIRCI